MNYDLRLSTDRKNIAIMRVENGWLIRSDENGMMGSVTPLLVAETPAALVEIVRTWAAAQQG